MSTKQYAVPTPHWLLPEPERNRLEHKVAQLEHGIDRLPAGEQANRRARISAARRALDNDARGRELLDRETHGVTADATPCGLRSRQATVDELSRLLDGLRNATNALERQVRVNDGRIAALTKRFERAGYRITPSRQDADVQYLAPTGQLVTMRRPAGPQQYAVPTPLS